jgi:hypothetical protein
MPPSESRAQQEFMGAELNRKRHGEKTETGMSEKQLEDFAATKHKGLPQHVAKKEEPKRGHMSDAHHGHGRHKRGRGEGSY